MEIRKLKEVLVIDDDEITCFLHSTFLENTGIVERVHCIHDGEKALDYIQEGIKRQVYPELILLDLNMAGIDGFQFLMSLKSLKTEETSKLNIVMLTATMSRHEEEATVLFKDLLKGHFLKPLDKAMFEKILRLIPHKEGLPKGKRKLFPSADN